MNSIAYRYAGRALLCLAFALQLSACFEGTRALDAGGTFRSFYETPTDLSAMPASPTSIVLQWSDENGDDEAGFEIKVSGGMNTTIKVENADARSFTHDGLSAGITYNYRIRVYPLTSQNKKNSSNWTSPVAATTPAIPINQPPSVDAGVDQSITLPINSTTLTGLGSDSDGTIASYVWTKLSGPTNHSFSTPNAATTQLSGLAQGSYSFRLTVTDDKGATATDDVIVNVNAAPNLAPTANAGADKTITLPTHTTTLPGSGSDSDGTIASYSWSKLSGPTVTVSGASTATLSLSNLIAGTYIFRLSVTDNLGAMDTDDVVVSVNAAPNQLPVADAGSDRSTVTNNSLSFSGSASTDPDGSIVSYSWNFGDGTSGNGVTVSHAYSAANTYTVTLTVTDNRGATDTDTAMVVVAASPCEFSTYTNVELNWDAPTQYDDLSPLNPSDITGYRVWHGPAANDLSQSVDAGTNRTLRVTSLTRGSTFYFAVTAKTVDSESEKSGPPKCVSISALP